MRKQILFLFALIITASFSWAQIPKSEQYSITLNGNTFTPKVNFQEMKENLKGKYPDKTPVNLGWFIIQFNSIPTIQEQKLLKNQGILLLNYIQGNAYFAFLSPTFLEPETSKAQKNIRSLISCKPEYKISNDFAIGDIPDYAKGDGDNIKVVITFFKNVDEQTLSKGIFSLNMKDVRILKRFYQIHAEVSKSDITTIASQDWVQNIEMVSAPAELDNNNAVTLHRVNILRSNIRGLGYGLTGKDVKIGLWDADVYKHRDFNNRVVNREQEMHDTDHGTHTCGTISSAGLLDPKATGMAPEAQIYSWNYNTQSNGKSVPEERLACIEEDGIEITSNSWGKTVKVCPNPNAYNSTDRAEDMIAYQYPYFLYVFSAGNTQTACPDGFKTSSKNMKNSLIVAAIDQMDNMSTFSSFGPTYDGRLIPNISGDGVRVYSTYLDNGYGVISGTSMATPGIAGTMALVYQRYKETHGGDRPNSAFLRALACNTAKDLGTSGPDYKFGYGEINGSRAVEVMEQNNYLLNKVSQGASFSKDITIPSGAIALKVMLAWTDPAGTVGASRILVNNLDLSVINGGTKILPWVLDPLTPSANAIRGIDNINNMEQVTIENPTAGLYTINVTGSEVPEREQEFAIVYDIVMPTLKLTYPIGGEYITPGDQEVIHWDCEGYGKTFTLEYSNDGGVNYSIIASNIAPNIRSFLWTVPSGVTSNAKIRISNGSALNEGKGSFNVMLVPHNVKVGQARCGGEGPFSMQWDAIPNAKYEVFKLNGQIYEHLADVTTNSYNITNIKPSNDNWYCVRAIDLTTGAKSQRSLAVTVNPASAIASLPFSETFESQRADKFYFEFIKGQGSTRYVNDKQKFGIRLEGSTTYTDWNTTATSPADCFLKNPNYIITAGICGIDATSLAGKPLRLKFDYRQKYLTTTGTSYFRVKVNGNYLMNSEGTQIYGTANQVSYKTVYYDLSPYAGNASVTIEIEAVCKTNYVTYVNASGDYDFSSDSYDKGDFVTIDNIEIYEPLDDLSLTSLTLGTGNTNAEAITIKVKNLSGTSVSNVPVSYTLNGVTVNETIADPIASMAEVQYIFNQKADLSETGKTYTVTASVNWLTDPISTNNTITKSNSNNGADIVMGIATGTVSTCSGTLTDPSGRFLDYNSAIQKLLVIKPDILGKKTKITFTEFETGAVEDDLKIWSGPSIAGGVQIATLSGGTLPPSFTSNAAGGELTFLWTTKGNSSGKGFIATIECVDGPAIDASVSAITAPTPSGIKTAAEVVTITVKNLGSQALTNVNVYYQINSLPLQTGTIPTLNAGQTLTYSFTTKADLSVAGQYTLKVWTEVLGDEDISNNSITKTITSVASKTDAGISVIPVFKPARETPTTISATVKNFGNQPINSIDAAYSINGAEIVQTFAGVIAAGATKVVTFTTKADFRAAGTIYNVDVYTKLAGDADASNDKQTFVIETPSAYSGTNIVGTFNGTNTIVEASAIPSMNLQANFTIECWVKPSAVAKYGRFFDKANITLFYQSDYSKLYPENSLVLGVTTAAGEFKYYYSSIMKLDQWQHIALTVNNSNEYILYRNGEIQTPTLVEGGVVGAIKANATAPLYIGNIADFTRGVKGCVDEFRVWNSVLSQSTIADNMMTDYPANTAGLIAYYKFKESNGKYLYDYSSNDNTAIISGADVSSIGDDKFWNQPGRLLVDLGFTGEATPTTFNSATNAFTSLMPIGTDLTSLVLNFTSLQNSTVKIGSIIQTSGSGTTDFTNAVTYTVEGAGFNSGISQTYTVNVSHDKNSACDLTAYTFETAENTKLLSRIAMDQNGNNYYKKITTGIDRSSLKARFTASPSAKVYINGIEQVSPMIAAIDYTNPVMVTVESENGRYMKNYCIFLDARNNIADLSAFGIIDSQVGSSTINSTDHTVNIWVKNSSDLSMLTSIFTVSPNANLYVGSITQRNGITSNNFTKPLVYTLVSEDESISTDWTVKVTKDVIKPVITLLGNEIIDIPYGSSYMDLGATASDDVDGAITSSIIVTGLPINTSPVGAYIVHYNVIDAAGNAADEVTRTVNVVKATATIDITNISQTYDGTAKTVSTATTPVGLTVNITYDGSSTAPTNAGTYAVVATINDANYQGTQNGTLTIGKATATISITETTQQYNGTPKAVTTSTTPSGLTVDVTYTGIGINYPTSATAPTLVGTYTVTTTINNANYTGSNTATLTITPSVGVDPSDLNSVRIYSNSTIVFVVIPELKGSAKLSIYNIIGNQIYYNDNLTQGVNRVDENFATGTYIVKVMVGNEVKTEKVVIQK